MRGRSLRYFQKLLPRVAQLRCANSWTALSYSLSCSSKALGASAIPALPPAALCEGATAEEVLFVTAADVFFFVISSDHPKATRYVDL